LLLQAAVRNGKLTEEEAWAKWKTLRKMQGRERNMDG
jgi:hypothetical protein